MSMRRTIVSMIMNISTHKSISTKKERGIATTIINNILMRKITSTIINMTTAMTTTMAINMTTNMTTNTTTSTHMSTTMKTITMDTITTGMVTKTSIHMLKHLHVLTTA